MFERKDEKVFRIVAITYVYGKRIKYYLEQLVIRFI